MSDAKRDGRVPVRLLANVLEAAGAGADAIIDGETRAVFCLTEKAQEAMRAAGKGHNDSINADGLIDFLKGLIETAGLKVMGVNPDGSMVWLVTKKTDADGSPVPARCKMH